MVILLAAAAALANLPPSDHRASATVQATATIRVVTGVQLKLDGSANPGAPPVRDSVLRSADGTTQAAKLIDFQ